MLSGVVQAFWGIRRKLSVVQAERAALAPAIKATLQWRTSVETAYQRLTELTKADRTAPHWSGVLTALSEHLSQKKHILPPSRARRFCFRSDLTAGSATQVFDDLEQTPGLTGVRAVVLQCDATPRTSGRTGCSDFSLAARAAPRRR